MSVVTKVIPNKTMIKMEFTGTPNKVIPRKDKLVKSLEVKFDVFDGWVEYPIYKSLDELPTDLHKDYNKSDMFYLYQPNHVYSDENGILGFRVIGATKKKSDKIVRLIVEDPNDGKPNYYIIENGTAIDCGWVFVKTFENYNSVDVNSEYKGYRNAKWIKLNKEDFSNLFGKVYSLGKVK